MSETNLKTFADFVLPPSLVSKLDVSRLLSELEWVDNEMTATSVRQKVNGQGATQPVFSDQLSEFLTRNELNLEDSHARSLLIKEVRQLKDKVPMIHMTFATPADRTSLQELAGWLRESIHPQAVIDVGLQPALVGGVYLRTPNHVHDFSLRAMLAGHQDLLAEELEKSRGK